MVCFLLFELTLVLDDEMASLIAPEFGYEPNINETAAFDIFPESILLDQI